MEEVEEDNSGPVKSFQKHKPEEFYGMEWHELMQKSIKTAEELANFFEDDSLKDLKTVIEKYPMRINSYYLSLIKEKGDPIWNQAIPNKEEIEFRKLGVNDPLGEEEYCPVKGLIHRYPDRVLLLVSPTCAMYCRFCTRKRKVGKTETISEKQIDAGIEYIKEHPEITDVLISGGDPLMLEDEQLDNILSKIRTIKHVEIIRIGSKVPCTMPQRVTEELVNILKKYSPLFLNTHFNHPSELTPLAEKALAKLADAGIPLGNQTVLMKNVNDDSETLGILFKKLLKNRVKPYYLFHADLVRGTEHFRTSVKKGIDIMQNLNGHISGMAVPRYVIDAPNHGGKICINPKTVLESEGKKLSLKNFEGRTIEFFDIEEYPSY